MTRPTKRADSSRFQFEKRVPADVFSRARGRFYMIELPPFRQARSVRSTPWKVPRVAPSCGGIVSTAKTVLLPANHSLCIRKGLAFQRAIRRQPNPKLDLRCAASSPGVSEVDPILRAFPAPRTIVRPCGFGGSLPSNFPSGRAAFSAASNRARRISASFGITDLVPEFVCGKVKCGLTDLSSLSRQIVMLVTAWTVGSALRHSGLAGSILLHRPAKMLDVVDQAARRAVVPCHWLVALELRQDP